MEAPEKCMHLFRRVFIVSFGQISYIILSLGQYLPYFLFLAPFSDKRPLSSQKQFYKRPSLKSARAVIRGRKTLYFYKKFSRN